MRKILVMVCLAWSSLELSAEAAVFKDVKGKVEFQLEGEDWMPAKVGVTLPKGAAVSTGFKSTAALEIMGSVITIKPLTRMVLSELIRNASGTKTGLTLLAGKVKAEVKPSSATSATVFDVKSPTATASVRGTGFEFDGENILVNHGDVVFSNQWNISRSVQGGEFSSAGKGASVSPPIPVKPAEKPTITAEGGSEQADEVVTNDNPVAGPEEIAPKQDYGLGQVIDTYGDELLLDKDIVTVVEEIQNIKEETLAQQTPVTLYELTLDIR